MSRASRPRDTLHVRLGQWFEATASGWGVVAVALVLAVLLVGAVLAGGSGSWPDLRVESGCP